MLSTSCTTVRRIVHAYVAYDQSRYLLMTTRSLDGISRVLRRLRRYVQYVNAACRRSGTLWEGRTKPVSSIARAT